MPPIHQAVCVEKLLVEKNTNNNPADYTIALLSLVYGGKRHNYLKCKHPPYLLIQLSLPVCYPAQANTCKEVDAKPHVGHGVRGEYSSEVFLEAGFCQALIQLHKTKVLREFL